MRGAGVGAGGGQDRREAVVALRQQLRDRFPSSQPSRRRRVESVSARSLAAGRGPWPTGVEAVDRLLPGGGFPGGRLSELTGPRSSGKTALALHAAARATAAGHPAAWIDLAHTLHPPSAAAAGVDLSRLLVVRPGGVKEALKAADILLRGRAFPLIVLDLGLRGGGGDGPDAGAAFARLNGLLSMGSEALLVVTSPETAWDPIRYYASVRLEVERVPWAEIVSDRARHGPSSGGASPARGHLRLLPSPGAPSPEGGGEAPPSGGGEPSPTPEGVGGGDAPPEAPRRPALMLASPPRAAEVSPGLTRASAPTPRTVGGRSTVRVVKNKLGAPGAHGEVGFGGWQAAPLPLHPGLPAPDPSR